MKFGLVIFFAGVLAFVSSNVLANNSVKTWQKPTPVFDQKFDWLRLTSNEWLKGDIISLYDDELDFDSDQFDLQTFDWDDVAELRSRFDKSIRLTSGQVIQGFLIVKDSKVTILSDGQATEFPLSELLTITSSSENGRNLWDGNIKLGANFLKGNTNQTDYSITALIQRRTPQSRYRADLLYNYSKVKHKTDNVESINANSRRLSSYFDWFYNADIFFRLLDAENFSDELQNIKTRNTLGLAFGYHIIDNKRVQWDLTIGPSYQRTVFLETTDKEYEQSSVLAFNTLLEYEISSKVDFVLDYQLQFVNEKSGDRLHNLKTGFDIDLAHDIDIDITFYIDRVANPLPTPSTGTPEENDYRLVFSVGYSF